jgi:hypothetical protein
MTMSESSGSLVTKLAEVMAAVERIPKRGRNDFHKYDYATEADIAATVRKELADRNVMLFPAITGESRHPVGEKGSVLTVIEMEMEFRDGDSGESITKPWRGYGTDKEDKGGYKAMTGGEKYFLLKTFLMPTGDDPEREDKEQRRERERVTVKPDRGAKKTRAKLPSDTVYLEAAVPKSRGNASWLAVTYIDAKGEQHEAVAVIPEVMGLITNIVQENVPAVVTVSTNAKGNKQLDMVERWKPEPAPSAVDEMPTAAEVF